MADVVREAGGVDDVGVAAQVLGDPAADLRDLQRVREPGARRAADLGALPRPDDLGLAGEAAQRRGVQHPGAVAGERAAAIRTGRALRGLRQRAGAIVLGVEVVVGHPTPLVSVSTEAWVSW